MPEIIRIARVKKNISQQDIAEELGVARSAVSKWESGLSQPGADSLIKLAYMLDIIQEIFPDFERKNPTDKYATRIEMESLWERIQRIEGELKDMKSSNALCLPC